MLALFNKYFFFACLIYYVDGDCIAAVEWICCWCLEFNNNLSDVAFNLNKIAFAGHGLDTLSFYSVVDSNARGPYM